MSVFQLVYTSTAERSLTQSELDSILSSAQRNNAKIGVTGFLIYDGENFIQLLEGDERDVQSIYKRILDDARHSHVEPLLQDTKPNRSLSNWAMAYTQLDHEGRRQSGGSMDPSKARELAAMLKQNSSPMRLIIAEFLSNAFSNAG